MLSCFMGALIMLTQVIPENQKHTYSYCIVTISDIVHMDIRG